MTTSWGVIEGFFGPEWTENTRRFYAERLRAWGASFYFYAPKRDARLRRLWRDPWSRETINEYSERIKTFHVNQVQIGFGLSPFELKPRLSLNDKEALRLRATQLNDLGVDKLGLFFDDMKSYEGLAESQLEALHQIRTRYHQSILFCPSYYSDDPILDKVFGPRPSDYERTLAQNLEQKIDVVWTGPQVISKEITKEHILSVNERWKRKVFLWENLYSNDGPKRCELLPLVEYSGRPLDVLPELASVGFNPMNEGLLASLMVRHATARLRGDSTPLKHQLVEWCDELEFVWQKHLLELCQGRAAIGDAGLNSLIDKLSGVTGSYALELTEFLEGKYKVGPECLTD